MGPLVPALVIVFGTELVVALEFLPRYLVPAPSDVIVVYWTNSAHIWSAFFETLVSTLIGFTLSVSVGISLGTLLASFRWAERAFFPYASFFQTVPIVAIAPLLVIWIGYGQQTVIVSAFIVSVFPMIASSLSGIQSTDSSLKDLFRLYGASRWAQLWKLEWPSALPQIFVGLRVSSGLAVIGAIVGEFIAGGGLGGLIDVARTRQRIDQVFAAILLASLIGLFLLQVIQWMRVRTLGRWHGSLVNGRSQLAKEE